jgi:hypothetical protein
MELFTLAPRYVCQCSTSRMTSSLHTPTRWQYGVILQSSKNVPCIWNTTCLTSGMLHLVSWPARCYEAVVVVVLVWAVAG